MKIISGISHLLKLRFGLGKPAYATFLYLSAETACSDITCIGIDQSTIVWTSQASTLKSSPFCIGYFPSTVVHE